MSPSPVGADVAHLEEVACNLCGSNDFQILYPSTLGPADTIPQPSHFRCTTATYGIHPTIVRCNVCNLVYANPRLNASAVEENYFAVDDPAYIVEREGRELTFQRNLEPLNRLVPTFSPERSNGHVHSARAQVSPNELAKARRLLDVGCHIGVLLEVAQTKGWTATGVEPSAWAARQAQERGLNVINSTLAGADLPSNHFDAVTLWDVVEHLTNPKADLNQVHRILKPGGVVAIHTIDIESIPARLMGKRWPWLMEMHLYFFSPRTLAHMLEDIGFKIELWTYQGRYLRFNYLTTRVQPYSVPIARALRYAGDRLDLSDRVVPLNTFDLFTMFARKT